MAMLQLVEKIDKKVHAIQLDWNDGDSQPSCMHRSKRRVLWELLSRIGDEVVEHWLIVGDFNSNLQFDEKKGCF
ncbi:hypothetical protein PVK06_015940 [Gossypium arboreum]|uniref:Uncharacterized protein n=1 Tax=Gossypium arboreum TaxID=29729 RepID=A0ABR0PYL8_GOSAR|nr:hypothetical protein PVK06_015940 [Gossypium arboreum]